jgi:hypothetical protein
MEDNNKTEIFELLQAGFIEPNTKEQFYACINAIKSIYELEDTNKTELVINFRDFLLDYLK